MTITTRVTIMIKIIVFTALISTVFASICHAENVEYLGSPQANIAKLLKERKCIGCNFKQADLSSLDLSGVNLTSSNLQITKLKNTNMSNAILKGVDFNGSTMYSTDFSGADMSDALLFNVNPKAKHARARNYKVKFNGAILSGAQILKSNLNGSNFTDANMNNVRMSGDFNNCIFSNANIQNSALGGSFDKSTFSNAKLNGSHIGGFISHANFNNADLSNTFIAGMYNYSSFDNATFVGSRIARSLKFINNSFKNTNFKGVDLRGIRLTRATLDGADFTGAKIGGKAYGLRLNKTDTSKAIGFGTSPPSTDYTKTPFSKYLCKDNYALLKIRNPNMNMLRTAEAAENSLQTAMSQIDSDYIETGQYSSIPSRAVKLLLGAAQKGNCKAREILRRRNDMLLDGDESVKLGYSSLRYLGNIKKFAKYKPYKVIPLRSLSAHYFSKFFIKGFHIGQSAKEARTLDLGKCSSYANNKNLIKCSLKHKVAAEIFLIRFRNNEVAYIKYNKYFNGNKQQQQSEIDTETARVKSAFGNKKKSLRCNSYGCMINNDGISFTYSINVRKGNYSYTIK